MPLLSQADAVSPTLTLHESRESSQHDKPQPDNYPQQNEGIAVANRGEFMIMPTYALMPFQATIYYTPTYHATTNAPTMTPQLIIH